MKKHLLSKTKLCRYLMLVCFVFAINTFSINSKDNSVSEIRQTQKKVTGIVKDKNGEALIGVNVSVKGTTTGVITDIDGKYSISADNNSVISFSYIGYKPKEIKVGNQTTIDLVLEEDSQVLDEIVVVGYGTQKKANLTGAVASADSKVFETRPVTSVATALQGVMAGVNIAPPTGNPNEDLSFNVRGETSINGGEPLVLVDGVETNLKLVNPSDIESVNVLKDAAAASIYGVRAAFGVVLITTKKGATDNKLKVNYTGNFGWGKATILPEFVDNSYDHAMFVNQALINNNSAVLYTEERLNAIKAYYEDPSKPNYYINKDGAYVSAGFIDWQKTLTKNYNPRQRHNVSISGGSGKTSFYASAGYQRQDGVLKINNDVFQKINTALNVENRTYDWMTLGMKMQFNTSEMDEPHKYKDEIWHAIVFSSPLQGGQWKGDPAYPQYDKFIGMYFEDQNNEVLLKYGGRNIKKSGEIIISPRVDFKPMKNWNIHLDFSYSKGYKNETEHRKHIDKLINARFLQVPGVTANNSYQKMNEDKDYYSFNAYTDYEFKLNEKHNFKVMAGYNQELTTWSNSKSKRVNLLSPEVPSLSLGDGEQTVEENGYQWALRGGFARLNYNYDNRYLLEINARYDGTSRFPKDDRFVLLPSYSIGWRLSEEKFMSFVKPTFDNIKFRASYGKLGNQLLTSTSWDGNNLKYYPYLPIMPNGLTDNYLFNQQKIGYINNPAIVPQSLTWEKVATLNGGLDLTLLSSRLDMSFDMYRRITSDMLIRQDYPEVIGLTDKQIVNTNAGTLQTDGWEISMKWRDKIGKDLSYNLGVVLYDSHAKITKYDGAQNVVDGYYKGKEMGEIWGYETEGFFTSEEDIKNHASQLSISNNWKVGDIKYKDLNGDEKINIGKNTLDDTGDRKRIGNSLPRYQYSINAGVTYKDLFLSVFFQGVGQRDYWPSAEDFWPVATQYYNTQSRFISESWTPENTNAYYALPRARSIQNQKEQTKYLQDASYLRLKNLTIGYNLPSNILKKVKLSKAQIYFSGENLWEHSNVVGPYDPEMSTKKGVLVYPFQRVYSVGIDLTF